LRFPAGVIFYPPCLRVGIRQHGNRLLWLDIPEQFAALLAFANASPSKRRRTFFYLSVLMDFFTLARRLRREWQAPQVAGPNQPKGVNP
jgi:hypothetical protein